MKSWREECGVFGIWGDPEAAKLSYLGLFAMQHRGQESAGIVSLFQGEHFHQKGLGLVGDVFNEATLAQLPGQASIGHVRYSTTGQNLLTNAQPLTAQLMNGPVALAHNGNIVNQLSLKNDLKKSGSIFHGTNDTEILLHLLSKNPSDNLVKALQESCMKIEGAFSFVVLSNESLIAIRDPWGFRPLVLGRKKLPNGAFSTVVASETCAFDLISAEYVREIEPGEIFWVDSQGEHSTNYKKLLPQFATQPEVRAQCIFEHVYFARPDSLVFSQSVYATRKKFGARLALESSVPADVVVPVPDSGVPAALGYSVASGIPYELGIIRNHYVGRTFIEPAQDIRDFGVKIKLNPQSAILKGQRVIVIDDSLVRGTTSKKIVNLIRQAGAREVHMRIASPPTTGPCYYGVDTPQKSQLIAARQTQAEICEFIGADSLAYLSNEGLFEAMQSNEKSFCAACFTGKYPTELFGLNR